ncbi:MAG: peptidylprolyl isomerase [Bryobacterales bacterium]|nr:peptidylprolyl isomerase [Bryobacterales bacterium]
MRPFWIVLLAASCLAAAPRVERVVLDTELGAIELELYPEAAPLTVANFLRLVDGRHLDGAVFFRTVSPQNDNGSPVISVIQAGLGERPSPFPPIAHETTDQTGLKHLDGTISMARGDVGTAASDFFICIGDQPALDYGAKRNADGQGFAAFGRVTGGMDVVSAIHRRPATAPTEDAYVKGQILDKPVRIISAKRIQAVAAYR